MQLPHPDARGTDVAFGGDFESCPGFGVNVPAPRCGVSIYVVAPRKIRREIRALMVRGRSAATMYSW
ncbi:hypothetical protein WS69_01340 [Burkholderia sp. BDU5]|nr:hypothetical protein WS69_01340 [Burkholderia sp. BDU5]